MTPGFRSAVLAATAFAATAFAGSPAFADAFSSQSFSGGTTTLEQLPGVNLDVAPGYGNGLGNCAEDDMPSFSGRSLTPQKTTTCRFGNFSITSGNSKSQSQLYDTTYGGNPPPWVPNWKP